jgi:hypothetical protein
MKPAGKVSSVLTFPSTLMIRCLTIAVTSRPVKAYFSRFRRKTVRGSDSRSLWGPGEGRGAYIISPCSLSYYSPNHSRRYRRACPASMMKGPRAFLGASWVLEPRSLVSGLVLECCRVESSIIVSIRRFSIFTFFPLLVSSIAAILAISISISLTVMLNSGPYMTRGLLTILLMYEESCNPAIVQYTLHYHAGGGQPSEIQQTSVITPSGTSIRKLIPLILPYHR